MNRYLLPAQRDQLLLKALQAAEQTALDLRRLADAALHPLPESGEPPVPPLLAASVELTPEGWLRATLPAILPKRDDGDRSRFLAASLRAAIRTNLGETQLPKFHACVLVYEFIYDASRNRRFVDHDNLELKHCQDVLEAAFLTNDTASLCSAFQCSHCGETDSTRIWILSPEQFPRWLQTHETCWSEPPKT